MLPADGGDEKEGLDLAGDHFLDLAEFVLRLVEGVAEHDLEAEGVGLPFDAPDKAGMVGVVNLRDDDTDETAPPGAEILRGAIGDVIASAGLSVDASTGGDTDVGGVAEGLGDGHDGKV